MRDGVFVCEKGVIVCEMPMIFVENAQEPISNAYPNAVSLKSIGVRIFCNVHWRLSLQKTETSNLNFLKCQRI